MIRFWQFKIESINHLLNDYSKNILNLTILKPPKFSFQLTTQTLQTQSNKPIKHFQHNPSIIFPQHDENTYFCTKFNTLPAVAGSLKNYHYEF